MDILRMHEQCLEVPDWTIAKAVGNLLVCYLASQNAVNNFAQYHIKLNDCWRWMQY